LLGGCSAWLAPVVTITAIITPSMPSMIATQRFSVRVISSSELDFGQF
jgi:hypothetical protein